MTIPLSWLLLILASVTGVQPPSDVSQTAMVMVRDELPADLWGYNCGGVRAIGSQLCPRGQEAEITVLGLWDKPLLMQHVAMHEYGHTLYPTGGEWGAEAYACRTVPLDGLIYNMTCHADGSLTVGR